MPHFFLADNGSLKPSATRVLRRLAASLADRAGVPVEAVSLQHADRIAVGDLDGQPAMLLQPALRQRLEQGLRDFVLLPLFFGRSRALTSFVPEVVSGLEQDFGAFRFELAETLYPLPEGDPGLVNILHDHLQAMQEQNPSTHVVLVDHGSPSPAVTRVREHIATELQARAKGDWQLVQAVMERRPGPEYDFNGPLLREWLEQQAQAGVSSVQLLMLFLLPGRHAGEHGDVAEICNEVMQSYPAFRVNISPLISEHPELVKLLHQRLQSFV